LSGRAHSSVAFSLPSNEILLQVCCARYVIKDLTKNKSQIRKAQLMEEARIKLNTYGAQRKEFVAQRTPSGKNVFGYQICERKEGLKSQA
jgi:hypothetical protein